MCEYVYENGVLKAGEGRQPVREFRHTWTTAARLSRIPREAMEYIQGTDRLMAGVPMKSMGSVTGLEIGSITSLSKLMFPVSCRLGADRLE
jgi:hypothetical protein